jgi:hypothetical protein
MMAVKAIKERSKGDAPENGLAQKAVAQISCRIIFDGAGNRQRGCAKPAYLLWAL